MARRRSLRSSAPVFGFCFGRLVEKRKRPGLRTASPGLCWAQGRRCALHVSGSPRPRAFPVAVPWKAATAGRRAAKHSVRELPPRVRRRSLICHSPTADRRITPACAGSRSGTSPTPGSSPLARETAWARSLWPSSAEHQRYCPTSMEPRPRVMTLQQSVYSCQLVGNIRPNVARPPGVAFPRASDVSDQPSLARVFQTLRTGTAMCHADDV